MIGQIKETRKELSYERMRAAAFDRMIEIAERHFRIPIRKNRSQTVMSLRTEAPGYPVDGLCGMFSATRQACCKAACGEKALCKALRNILVADFAKEDPRLSKRVSNLRAGPGFTGLGSLKIRKEPMISIH